MVIQFPLIFSSLKKLSQRNSILWWCTTLGGGGGNLPRDHHKHETDTLEKEYLITGGVQCIGLNKVVRRTGHMRTKIARKHLVKRENSIHSTVMVMFQGAISGKANITGPVVFLMHKKINIQMPKETLTK